MICLIVTAIGYISTVLSSSLAVDANVYCNIKYEDDISQYEQLKDHIDDENYTEAINTYNKKVSNYKKYHDSWRVGAFYYNGCENLPFIENDD